MSNDVNNDDPIVVLPSTAPLELTPSAMLDLVDRDLRGKLDSFERAELDLRPVEWIGTLQAILKNVDDQLTERDAKHLDQDGGSSAEYLRWHRKATKFRRVLQVRINQVRELLPAPPKPEDPLRALVAEALNIKSMPELAQWQTRAKIILSS